MLAAYPAADVAVAVVWIPMLPGDDEPAARKAVSLVADARARHFYDGERLAGRAIAASLGTEGAHGEVAWDMYLFFDRGARWVADAPPTPADWLHQLRGRAWADPQRWRWGADLGLGLLEMAGRQFAQ